MLAVAALLRSLCPSALPLKFVLDQHGGMQDVGIAGSRFLMTLTSGGRAPRWDPNSFWCEEERIHDVMQTIFGKQCRFSDFTSDVSFQQTTNFMGHELFRS